MDLTSSFSRLFASVSLESTYYNYDVNLIPIMAVHVSLKLNVKAVFLESLGLEAPAGRASLLLLRLLFFKMDNLSRALKDECGEQRPSLENHVQNQRICQAWQALLKPWLQEYKFKHVHHARS